MSTTRTNHIPRLLALAGPMILSTSVITLMQLVDAMVLSRYSNHAVAAIGPAGMAVLLFQGFLFGITGYTGTFVAHAHGQADHQRIMTSIWIGLQVSLAAGVIALLTAWPLASLFLMSGHDVTVAQDERTYFLICMAGSLFPILNAAWSGWLAGVGRPAVVTVITFLSFFANAYLAWAMVLGHGGFTAMGIAGAAWSTVVAQALASVCYLVLFIKEGGLRSYAARCLDTAALRHFLELSVPMGIRISGELFAWTIFLIFVGRIGTVELAATSIAFRINGTAFFPALGLGQAAGILVGHARGAGHDNQVMQITRQSLLVAEIWMLIMALLFVLAAPDLMSFFVHTDPQRDQIITTGTILMRFVAFYCLFDAANVMVGAVLAAAGDTRWIARSFVICSSVFLILLWVTDYLRPDLYTAWSLATLFVFVTALLWIIRLVSGKWHHARVLPNQ